MRLLLPILLAGCAAEAPLDVGDLLDEPVGAMNEILITRPARSGRTDIAPILFLEAREIGRCTTDQPTLIRVPDGTWALTALTLAGEVTRTVTLSGNQNVELICGNTGGTTPAPVLALK